MSKFNSMSNMQLNEAIMNQFKLYNESGNERAYLGRHTYELVKDLTFRKFIKSYNTHLADHGNEIVYEVIGDILTRIKKFYHKGTPLQIDSFVHYLDTTIKFKVSNFMRKKYVNFRGHDIMLVFEDIGNYAEDMTEEAPYRRATTHPESHIMFQSELNDLVKLAKFHLSRNEFTSKNTKLLLWPVLIGAIRNKENYYDKFDTRTTMYLRYVTYQMRRAVIKKFTNYNYLLA